MLSRESIESSLALRGVTGVDSSASCDRGWKVLPPPTSNDCVRFRSRLYFLEWFDEKGEPCGKDFRAQNKGLAVIKAMRILGIRGRLTRWKLRQTGKKQILLHHLVGQDQLLKPKH